MRPVFLAVLTAVVLFSTEACGPRGDMNIGNTDNGSQVVVQVGQTLILGLDSNPTTGYQWQITELDEAILEQIDYGYEAEQPALAGSGGKEVWQFQARSSGSTKLSLGYRRSWEEGVEPIQTFSVEVVVR